MGSARVQYELERTLPSLQLCDERGIFSKEDEIRQISHRRSQFEQTLVRRHVKPNDFVRYFQYEDKLDKLLHLRIAKVDLAPKEAAQLRRDSSAHIISIFERGVKKCRYDVDLWQRYIGWASAKNMRLVVGRVTARAIALHPTRIQLWLSAANHELNINYNPASARALLQRALRANAIPHGSPNRAYKTVPPPSKRAKVAKEKGSSPKKGKGRAKGKGKGRAADEEEEEDEEADEGDGHAEQATLKLSDQEKDVVHLWIEYVRMELVFMERLRRRRAVLGHEDEDDEATAQEAQKAEEATLHSEPAAPEDEEVAKTVAETDEGVDETEEQETIPTMKVPSAATSISEGAIVTMILKSATDVDSSTSLPPHTHFAFILAFIKLVRTFPLHRGQKLVKILDAAYDTLQARYPSDPAVMTYIAVRHLIENEIPVDESLETKKLRLHSRLCDSSCGPSSKVFAEAKESPVLWNYQDRQDQDREDLDGEQVLGYVMKEMKLFIFDSRGKTSPERINDVLKTTSAFIKAQEAPKSLHYAAQLRIVAELLYSEFSQGKELYDYIKALLHKCFKDAERANKVDSNVLAIYLGKEYSILESALTDCLLFDKDDEAIKILKDITHLYKQANDALEKFEREGKAGRYDSAMKELVLIMLKANARVVGQIDDEQYGSGGWVVVKKKPEEADLEKAWDRYLQTDRTGDEDFNAVLWDEWCYEQTKEEYRSRTSDPESRRILVEALKSTMNKPKIHLTILQYYFWCNVLHLPPSRLYEGLYSTQGDEEDLSGRERAANGQQAQKSVKYILEKTNPSLDFYRWATFKTLYEVLTPAVHKDEVGAGTDADRVTKQQLKKVFTSLFERLESLTRNRSAADLDEEIVADVHVKLRFLAQGEKNVTEAGKVFQSGLMRFNKANRPDLAASLEKLWKGTLESLAKSYEEADFEEEGSSSVGSDEDADKENIEVIESRLNDNVFESESDEANGEK